MSELSDRMARLRTAVENMNALLTSRDPTIPSEPILVREEVYKLKLILRRLKASKAMEYLDDIAQKSELSQRLVAKLIELCDKIVSFSADPSVMYQLGMSLLREAERLSSLSHRFASEDYETLWIITNAVGQFHDGFARSHSTVDADIEFRRQV